MRRAPLLFAALAVALLACPGPPPTPTPDAQPGTDAGADLRPAAPFAEEAHRRALETLLPLAEAALIADDPVGAAQIDKGPLRPRAFGLVGMSERRDALRPALAEASEIDEGALPPDKLIVLRTLRFGLYRMNDRGERRPWERDDPTVSYAELAELVDELEYRLLTGACAGCVAAVERLTTQLANPADFSATSSASAAAALEDLDLLGVRLADLPDRAPAELAVGLRLAVEGAAAPLAARREQLTTTLAELATATVHEWDAKPLPLGRARDARRLPDVVGAKTLLRRLAVEEGVDADLNQLLAGTTRNLGRYRGMGRGLADVAASKASAVTTRRCQQENEHLEHWVAVREDFSATPISCEVFVRFYAGVAMSDAELTLALVDARVIEPMRRSQRAGELPAIALVRGRWSPYTHMHLRRLMILMADYSRPEATRLALTRAREDLCLAGAALWLHGELGDSDARRSWLAGNCADFDPASLERRALARPRAALRGLGLSTLSDQMHEMVGLDLFYWAPLGNIPMLATPRGEHPDQRPPAPEGAGDPSQGSIEIKIEELGATEPQR